MCREYITVGSLVVMNYCLQNVLCWTRKLREPVEKAMYQMVPS